jgi:valyl-tRNA synthetase
MIELAHSDRSKTPIEPFLHDQWFVKMDGLAQNAIDAVNNGDVKIIPDRYKKGYTDWLSEKRDWPIGRQLWWGHRIPIWYCSGATEKELEKAFAERQDIAWQWDSENNVWWICSQTEDLSADAVSGYTLIQEEDVLDTWFSSALWPHSTLGWPSETPELDYYYPTGVLITNRDILTLWVARMVLAGKFNTGQKPFHEVFIHPKILDKYGEGMSKSKGNGVDPISVIAKFGADALRFALAFLTTENQDIRLMLDFECPYCGAVVEQTKKNRTEPKIVCPKCRVPFRTQWAETETDLRLTEAPMIGERFEVARNFCNKLWNAARFVLLSLQEEQQEQEEEQQHHINTIQLLQHTPKKQLEEVLGQFIEHAKNVYEHAPKIIAVSQALDEVSQEFIAAAGQMDVTPREVNRIAKELKCTPKLLNNTAELLNNTAGQMSVIIKRINKPPEHDSITPKQLKEMAKRVKETTKQIKKTIRQFNETVEQLDKSIQTRTPNNTPFDNATFLFLEDRWILSRLAVVTQSVTESLETYRYADAMRFLYDFAWNEFCSFYVEIVKSRLTDPLRRQDARTVLVYVLNVLLRLLHPVVPFVTEEIWQRLRLLDNGFGENGNNRLQYAESIAVSSWPEAYKWAVDTEIEDQFEVFREVLRAVRDVRASRNVPPKTEISFAVRCDTANATLLKSMESYFLSMAKAKATGWGEMVKAPALSSTVPLVGMDVYVDLSDLIDIPAEIAKLEKEIAKLDGFIKSKESKLDSGFANKAPAAVVEKERQSLAELQEQRQSAAEAVKNLLSLRPAASIEKQ